MYKLSLTSKTEKVKAYIINLKYNVQKNAQNLNTW